MKPKIRPVLLLLSILVTPTLIFSQGPKKPRALEDYVPRTLRQLSELQPDNVANEPSHKDADIIVHGELLPTRVKVTYSGEKRSLLQDKKTVIANWANKFAGAPEFYTAPYETEMLFTENGETYWLAVRKEFVPQFEQQLKKGETIELFLIKMGSIRINGKLEPVIMVEKFLTPATRDVASGASTSVGRDRSVTGCMLLEANRPAQFIIYETAMESEIRFRLRNNTSCAIIVETDDHYPTAIRQLPQGGGIIETVLESRDGLHLALHYFVQHKTQGTRRGYGWGDSVFNYEIPAGQSITFDVSEKFLKQRNHIAVPFKISGEPKRFVVAGDGEVTHFVYFMFQDLPPNTLHHGKR